MNIQQIFVITER